MGPSVKFVLPIIDAFPDKKMGVIFWAGWDKIPSLPNFFLDGTPKSE